MVGRAIEKRNKKGVEGIPLILNITNRHHEPNLQVHSRASCMRILSCFILMSEGGLMKSMWTGLPPSVDGVCDSSSGGVLGAGDGGNDSQEELGDESE